RSKRDAGDPAISKRLRGSDARCAGSECERNPAYRAGTVVSGANRTLRPPQPGTPRSSHRAQRDPRAGGAGAGRGFVEREESSVGPDHAIWHRDPDRRDAAGSGARANGAPQCDGAERRRLADRYLTAGRRGATESRAWLDGRAERADVELVEAVDEDRKSVV